MQPARLKIAVVSTLLLVPMLIASASTGMANTDAPRWEVGSICQAAKSVTACTRREALSRATVLDRWLATPEGDRQFCLEELKTKDVESYWSLLDCLGNRAIANDAS